MSDCILLGVLPRMEKYLSHLYKSPYIYIVAFTGTSILIVLIWRDSWLHKSAYVLFIPHWFSSDRHFCFQNGYWFFLWKEKHHILIVELRSFSFWPLECPNVSSLSWLMTLMWLSAVGHTAFMSYQVFQQLTGSRVLH